MGQVDIILWMKCNEKCSFCFQDTKYIKKYDVLLDKKDILKLLIKWKKLWLNMVNISWWEPTIYEDNFNYILKLSSKLLYRDIKVITNWIQFSKLDFCNNNLKYITDIWLSFHSASNKNIQDKLTWLVWSYDLVIRAIKNIKKLSNINLHNHCVITNDNIDILEEHIKKIIKLWFISIHFMSLMHNTDNNKTQSYDFNKLASLLKWIIDKYKNKIIIELSYIQPCYFKWYEKYVQWFEYWKEYISNNVNSLKSWEKTILSNKYLEKKCINCKYLNECHGFWKK